MTAVLRASLLLAAATGIAAWAQAPKDSLVRANAALQAGEADRALAMLSSLPESAESHNLKCRVLLTLNHWDAAASECALAVRMDGQNSDYHLWLGRALGEKADRASFLSAFSLGKNVREEFEESVREDPRNAEALADLAEFYYSAPAVVGGGTSKAYDVASRLDKVDPVRAHELRGRLAENNKDYGAAEREFRQALAVSTRPAFQWMTLASFYQRRGRVADMESAVENGMKIAQRDSHSSVALYDAASVLTKAKRDLDLAAKLLAAYLASPTKTEEAPAFVAHLRLARLMAQQGDTAGAHREQAAALELAHDYRPAQELKY